MGSYRPRANLTNGKGQTGGTCLLVTLLLLTTVTGCVNSEILKDTLTQLEESRTRTTELALELSTFKSDADQRIGELQREQRRLGKALVRAQNTAGDTQSDLESSEYYLASERQTREEMGDQLGQLLIQRQVLGAKLEELRMQLEGSQEKLGNAREEHGRARARIENLEEEQAELTNQLTTVQSAVARARFKLKGVSEKLTEAQRGRQEAEHKLAYIAEQQQKLDRLGKEVRRERDGLRTSIENLRRGLEAAQVALTGSRRSLTNAHGRIANLEEEKTQALMALRKAHKQANMLESALVAEQTNWNSLQKALGEGLPSKVEPASN